jgi:4-amino-4-deoxy-L-arabinose transferase-like glycosyltransferase
MNARTKLPASELFLVLCACLFFFFYALGSFGLVGADEPRYAQIGREMLARHDWIVPTLNGQPWLEKPVLLYWREMVAYSIFGVHDWVARLPSATFAAALVFAIFFFMRRFRPGSELNAALITASTAGVIGFARGASTDMQLTAPFCVAMLAWWAWHQTDRKLWLAAFYGLLGLGMLAKGPVAPGLAVLIVAAYAGLRRDGKIFLRSVWLPGFALFLAIVLPWYIAMQVRVPAFLKTFFLQQNLERFSSNLYRHSQPFWYYVPVFLLAVLPWVVFTVPALAGAVREGIRNIRAREESAEQPQSEPADMLEQFLALWVLVPIVFFSISRSKLPGYILPSIPPAAVLTTAYLHRTQAISRVKAMIHSLVCAVLVAAALLVPWMMLKQTPPQATKNIVVVATGIVAVFVLVAVRRGGLRLLRVATLAPFALGLVFLLRTAAPIIDQTKSARPVARNLERAGATGPAAVFDVKRDVEYGLNFYLDRPVCHYEQGGVPDEPECVLPGQHVVVGREGSRDAVQALAGDRRVSSLGRYLPQHLEFFRVSNK